MPNVLSGCVTAQLPKKISMPKHCTLNNLLYMAGLLLLTSCGEPQGTAPGHNAPEISVLDLQEHQLRVSDYRGRVLVLNFWFGGCGPCIAEMPHMNALYQQYKNDGLTILGINRGEDQQAVEDTIRRVSVSYPIAIDQLGISAKRYRVKATPATFVLDKQGVLRERVMGKISRKRLEGIVLPLLGVPAKFNVVNKPVNTPSVVVSQIAEAARHQNGDVSSGHQLYQGNNFKH